MTGFGFPCGACKFLRRKCVEGCVFAPCFCHDQGAAHFASIHKVFGASNVSKLLMHLPAADRSEAALTISYEAQARLQDPVYGCVSHIFALQQQVVNLQAQLTSLKAQAGMQDFATTISTSASSPRDQENRYNNFQPYNQQEWQGLYHTETSNFPTKAESMMYYENCMLDDQNPSNGHDISFRANDSSSCEMQPVCSDMEGLQSIAFAYLHPQFMTD